MKNNIIYIKYESIRNGVGDYMDGPIEITSKETFNDSHSSAWKKYGYEFYYHTDDISFYFKIDLNRINENDLSAIDNVKQFIIKEKRNQKLDQLLNG